MTAPYLECPRFSKCSVNNCPLHPGYPTLYTDPEDKETVCKLGKTYRVRIAEKYPDTLQMDGLTKREYASKMAWVNRPHHERVEHLNRLKETAFTTAPQKEHDNAIVGEGGE